MIRWTRVLVAAFVFSTGIVATFLWKIPPPAKPTLPTWVPWIGLPAIPMDISNYESRSVLFYVAQDGGRYPNVFGSESLSRTCGGWGSNEEASPKQEIYVALMGDSSFAGAKIWRVEFQVEGDQVTTLIDYNSSIPYPQPEPGFRSPMETPTPVPIRRVVFKKSQLQPIVDAWRDPQLWDAPQEIFQCSDGMPSILEACVHGHYAVRARNCSDAIPKAFHLWQTIQRLLPPADAPDSN
ncbi:MAG: hypothetical protein ABIQ97_06000 [Lysobacteraceae bacterium]